MLTVTGDPLKVLILDDEVVIASTLRSILEQQGVRVAVAFDGKTAVSVASTFEPDVLVADVQMPKLNGIEAAIQIVRRSPKCKVFVYTGKVLLQESLAQIKQQGFGLIERPIAPTDLLDRLRELAKMGRRRTSFQAVVLNVNDNEIQRYAVTRMLTHRGFVVREARSGAEALKEAQKHPDLILLDINLPDISGFEVCKRLKQSPTTSDIPVVHLTNTYRDDVAKAQALSCGAEDVFTYPAQPEELFTRLQEIIDKSS